MNGSSGSNFCEGEVQQLLPGTTDSKNIILANNINE